MATREELLARRKQKVDTKKEQEEARIKAEEEAKRKAEEAEVNRIANEKRQKEELDKKVNQIISDPDDLDKELLSAIKSASSNGFLCFFKNIDWNTSTQDANINFSKFYTKLSSRFNILKDSYNVEDIEKLSMVSYIINYIKCHVDLGEVIDQQIALEQIRDCCKGYVDFDSRITYRGKLQYEIDYAKLAKAINEYREELHHTPIDDNIIEEMKQFKHRIGNLAKFVADCNNRYC